jgi:hypothetical protein
MNVQRADLEAACFVSWSSTKVCRCSGLSAAREVAILIEADVLPPTTALLFGDILQYL